MAELIDLYFNRVNVLMPILHRPTLDKGIADGLHWQDPGFGEIVLLVCAVASRHSNDPRIFFPNVRSEISAGWKWFNQVRTARKPMLSPPCLYDLQAQYVGVIFILPFRILKVGLVVRHIFAQFFCSPEVLVYGWRRYSACPGSGRP
jgi:hypothetical protein